MPFSYCGTGLLLINIKKPIVQLKKLKHWQIILLQKTNSIFP